MRPLDTEKPKMLTNYEVYQSIKDWQTTDLINDKSIETRPERLDIYGQETKSKNLPNGTGPAGPEIIKISKSELQALNQTAIKHNRNIKFMVKATTKFLEHTEAIIASDYENIKLVHKICKKYLLTEAETLQVLNNRPSNEQMLYLIIEDVSERLTDEQQREFIGEIKRAMPIMGME